MSRGREVGNHTECARELRTPRALEHKVGSWMVVLGGGQTDQQETLPKGTPCHVEEFGFYLRNNGEPLKECGYRTVVMRSAVWAGQCNGGSGGQMSGRKPRGEETSAGEQG